MIDVKSAFPCRAPKLVVAWVLVAVCTVSAEPAPSAPASSSPTYKKVTVELRPHNGRPTLFLDGKPTALPSYSPEGWNKPRFMAAVPRFQRQGMGAYFISPVGIVGDPNATQFWSGDVIGPEPHGVTSKGEFDSLDEQAQMILAGDPDACLIVRFNIYEPASWRKLHPGEYFVTDEGKSDAAPSMASQAYWDASSRFSAALVQYCESRPWAGRVIGYANFHRQEGSHEPVMNGWLFDHSQPMTARWRGYLKKQYADLDKLRKAYADPEMTFENAQVPTDALHGPAAKVADSLYWQAPADNQPLRDYLELNALLFKQATRQLGQAMREAMKDRKLIFFDAIKQPLQGWNHAAFFNENKSWNPNFICLNSGSGAVDLAGLLEMPGLDGLITPHDYQARGAGGVFEPEGAVDSAILRGKYFLCEMDTRTYVDRYKAYGVARDDREFSAVTWRNLATAFTRGFNPYWMDLSNDWYSTDAMQATISRQVQAMRESVNWLHETVPGIAMIIDDTAVLETNGRGAIVNDAIMWEAKMGLARCGVPFRIYLLDDLKLPIFPRHRVFYFPNLYKIDAERLALLKEKVFRDGNVVLFGPGSGISDGKTISTNSAHELTGFEFEKLVPANYPRRTLIDSFDHPITAGLSADTIIGGPLAYGPMLFPKDGVSLGRAWTKQGRDYSGLAVKTFGKGARGVSHEPELLGPSDWASVFTTATPIPAGLWRGLARFGGAHVYSEENDIVLADRSVVAFHSLKSGPKVLSLPGESKVTDLVTGQVIGDHIAQIKFDLIAPQTAVFHVEPSSDDHSAKRSVIRVGVHDGDIQGSDDRALQKAVDQVAGLGGGTVNILPGRYLMRNALKLRDHVDVVGAPGETILAVCDGFKSPLALDGDCYERKITLADPSGFRVGDGVCISDDKEASDFMVTIATLTERIDPHTFKISAPLYLDYMVKNHARARLLFPVIGGWNVKNVRVEGLTIDGNRTKTEFLDGCRTGGIYLFESQDIILRNCNIHDFNGDAISFQVSDNIIVEDCALQHNSGSGLHPGSGSHHPIVRRNRATANDADGIFVCWRVQDGLFEANEFRGNKRDGISLGHKDSDNVFRNNSSIENGSFGVLFRKESEPMGAHRNLFEANRIFNNGIGAEAAHPAQIVIRGPHHDLVFRQNEIGAAADRGVGGIGILATDRDDPSTLKLDDNRFPNMQTKVKTDK